MASDVFLGHCPCTPNKFIRWTNDESGTEALDLGCTRPGHAFRHENDYFSSNSLPKPRERNPAVPRCVVHEGAHCIEIPESEVVDHLRIGAIFVAASWVFVFTLE